jgi:hypothetical protein
MIMYPRVRYTRDYCADNTHSMAISERLTSPTGFESLLLDAGSPEIHGLIRLCYQRNLSGLLSSAIRVLAATLFEPLGLDSTMLATEYVMQLGGGGGISLSRPPTLSCHAFHTT